MIINQALSDTLTLWTLKHSYTILCHAKRDILRCLAVIEICLTIWHFIDESAYQQLFSEVMHHGSVEAELCFFAHHETFHSKLFFFSLLLQKCPNACPNFFGSQKGHTSGQGRGFSIFKLQPRVWPKIWLCTKFGSPRSMLYHVARSQKTHVWGPLTGKQVSLDLWQCGKPFSYGLQIWYKVIFWAKLWVAVWK